MSLVLLILIPFQVERTEAALTEPVVGSRVYPLLIVLCMMGLSAFRAWRAFKKQQPEPTDAADLSMSRSLWGALLIVLYVCLMPWLGFVLASFLAMLAAMRLLGEPLHPMGAAFCAASVALVWFIFGYFLEIPLPTGVF
jgi:hypothetical protein